MVWRLKMDIEKLTDIDYWRDTATLLIRRIFTFRRKEQIELLEDLASNLDSGVQLLEAFQLLTRIYSNSVRDVSQNVIKCLNDGVSFTNGLVGWYPREVITSIRVGEEHGLLVKTIRNVIEYLKTSSKGLRLFLFKLSYPLVIICMAFIMAHFVVNDYFNLIKEFKDVSEWPVISVYTYHFWQFALSFWFLFVLLIFAVGIAVNYMLTSFTGINRNQIDSLPIFKQYRLKQGSVFLTTLGLMLQNGISLSDSLNELDRGSTPYLKYHLRRMRQKLHTGHGNEGDYLDTGLIEKNTINRLKALSEVNDFEVAMVRLGVQTLDETGKKLELASEVVKYIGLFLAACSLGSIFAGALSLTQAFT